MRRLAALVLGTTLLVLPACGSKTDETSRAAGITPATALGMVSVNLSPSIEQKRNLLSIARLFPGAQSKVKGEFDEARNEVLDAMFEDSGLDFKTDIAPWLGKEAAVAVLPPGDAGAPLILAMVQTDDQEKARAAIAKATKEGDFDGVYAIVDDFVVISSQDDEVDNQPALDQIAAQAKKDDGGLAKSAEFTNVVDQLHGDRLVLGWVDTKDSLAVLEDLGGLEDLVKQFGKDATAVAFDLHAEQKAVVFQGVAAAKGAASGSDLELTRSLPAGTLAAFTSFGIGTSVAKVLIGVESGEGDLLAGFEDQTGINLENDILSWMQGEAVLVAGAVRGEQPFPDFALVVEPTDKAKAEAGLAKIRSALAEQDLSMDEQSIGGATAYVLSVEPVPGIQPAMALFPDRFVLANSPAFLGDLAKAATPGLGDNGSYKAVVGDPDDDTSAQFVVLIDPIREAIEKSALNDSDDRAEYEKDVRPNLEPLSAFGFKAHRDGGYNRFEMKLTFD